MRLFCWFGPGHEMEWWKRSVKGRKGGKEGGKKGGGRGGSPEIWGEKPRKKRRINFAQDSFSSFFLLHFYFPFEFFFSLGLFFLLCEKEMSEFLADEDEDLEWMTRWQKEVPGKQMGARPKLYCKCAFLTAPTASYRFAGWSRSMRATLLVN